jgi:hypothetical protein
MGRIEVDDVADTLAPKFATMFTSLLRVMAIQESKERAKKERQEQQAFKASQASASTKRSADSQATIIPAKRARIDSDYSQPEPLTPSDQNVIETEATFTGGTDKSGRSIEYKDEESSKQLVYDILRNTMSALGVDFRRIGWQKSGNRIELVET